MLAIAAETSAARSGTVPKIVPSFVMLPPSSSVSISALPPTVAADSSRNGSVRRGVPAVRNSGSENSRKHGTLQYHARRSGSTNSDSSA